MAEAGHDLEFVLPEIDMSESVAPALEADLELTDQARQRFIELSQAPELAAHTGLKTELEHMIYQEEFLAEDVKGLMGEAEEPASRKLEFEPEALPSQIQPN